MKLMKQTKVTILIVDDEVLNCMSMERFLRKKGFEVFKAHNGVEAIEVLTKERVSIVLLDIMMPKMGGMETLREIKNRYSRVKVIMVSASCDTPLVSEAIKLGAYGCLDKPVDLENLYNTIGDAFKFEAQA